MSLGNLNLQLPPQVSNWIKVWELDKPLCDCNVLLLEPLLCCLGHMFWATVMLANTHPRSSVPTNITFLQCVFFFLIMTLWTVHFFESGQIGEISSGSKYYFVHCISTERNFNRNIMNVACVSVRVCVFW